MEQKRRNSEKPDIEIGNRIKEYRLSLGISQREIAEKINLSQKQIAFIENGKSIVSAQTLFEIAKILEKPVSYFYGEKVSQNTKFENDFQSVPNMNLEEFLKLKGIENDEVLEEIKNFVLFVGTKYNYNLDNL